MADGYGGDLGVGAEKGVTHGEEAEGDRPDELEDWDRRSRHRGDADRSEQC